VAGAEILDDDVRQRIARLKCNTEDWVSVHRMAHQLGMRNHCHHDVRRGRDLRQRINSLRVVRRLQEETGGSRLLPLELPTTTQPSAAVAGKKPLVLNFLKCCYLRLYLDNIEKRAS